MQYIEITTLLQYTTKQPKSKSLHNQQRSTIKQIKPKQHNNPTYPEETPNHNQTTSKCNNNSNSTTLARKNQTDKQSILYLKQTNHIHKHTTNITPKYILENKRPQTHHQNKSTQQLTNQSNYTTLKPQRTPKSSKPH